jgi:hypothetical protein
MWRTTKKGIKYLPVGTRCETTYMYIGRGVILGYYDGYLDSRLPENRAMLHSVPRNRKSFVFVHFTHSTTGKTEYGHDTLTSLYDNYTPDDLAGIIYDRLLKEGTSDEG